MVELCAIASGSNGNCYYVGNENEAVLVDVGIYTKKVINRMEESGLSIEKVKAIFISHEHADHMRGVKVLSKRYNIPVYMTYATYNKSWNPNRPAYCEYFEPGVPIQIGDITIHSFLKKHDAAEPCSFNVEVHGKHIGVMTDIGEADDQVKAYLKKCDAVFLESNYDPDLLMNGPYPWPLKKRVSSDVGHLSNEQAATLAKECLKTDCELLLLAHLSGENNTREKALAAFADIQEETIVEATYRNKPTKIYRLGHIAHQLTLDL